MVDRFHYYFCGDEIEVKQTIKEIEDREDQELKVGSLKFLKFMLASQSDRGVPYEVLKKLLERERCLNLNSYEEVLREARLIEPVSLNHRWYYRFREPHWKYRISTTWHEWNESESVEAEYSTKLFDALCEVTSRPRLPREERWNPEQARKSWPSTEAVEVLYNQGLYYYKYHGHSDAGYALRFLGREKGGALTKWLSLCNDVHGEELWEYLYWEPKTFLSPYRGLESSRLMPDFSAPDLVINTATAYWVCGHTEKAYETISQWKSIRGRLSGHLPPRKEYRDHLLKADKQIDLLHAKILLCRGESNDLRRAWNLSERHVNEEPEAKFILANVEHYSHFATGRWLAPLRFEPDDQAVEKLLKVGRDTSGDDYPTRLRALYSVCSAMWDGCFEEPIAPEVVISKGIPESNVHPERLDCLRQTIEESIALLTEALPYIGVRPTEMPLGGRAAEAKILFWEAVFLYQTCMLFATDVGLAAEQKGLTDHHGEQDSGLEAYASLAELCEKFAYCGLFTDEQQGELLSKINEYTNWVQGQLGKSSSDVHYPTVRMRINSLFSDVFTAAIRQAGEYFTNADTVYRRLGHLRGRAEVLFQRGLMLILTKVEPDGTPWQELLANSNQISSELGFHLDRLYSRIAIARAGQDSKPYKLLDARSAYQNAIRWCSDLSDADFPKLVVGELSFKLGLLLHNQGSYLGATITDALDVMERAREEYEPYWRHGASFVTRKEALDRMISIRCSLAELRRREADNSESIESWRDSLDEAMRHCRWIIRQAKKEAQFKSSEMKARLIEADVSLLREDFQTAINGYEAVIDYWVQEASQVTHYHERQRDQFHLLQALLRVFKICKISKEIAQFRKMSDADLLNRLTQVADSFKENQERDDSSRTIGDPETSLLLEASLVLGDEFLSNGDAYSARKWFLEAFQAYESLGRFGQAILLDSRIRETLALAADEEYESRKYKDILHRASEQIDDERENADWEQVFKILGYYFPVQATTATPHLLILKKQDLLRSGSVSMEYEENLDRAISTLESGKNLIDLENPEEIDLEILDKLRDAYRETRSHYHKVRELDRLEQDLKDVNQTRNYLSLARTYLQLEWDANWALRIAINVVKKDSSYYAEAEQLLEERLDRGRE